MIVTLDPKLEAALKDQANRKGVAPEELALKLLRERLLATVLEPRDEWERVESLPSIDRGINVEKKKTGT